MKASGNFLLANFLLNIKQVNNENNDYNFSRTDWIGWPDEWRYEDEDDPQLEADLNGETAEWLFYKNHKHPRKFIVKKEKLDETTE